MNWLAFAGIVVIGFVACAEFGSYAFVHPVLRRLPQREWITTEQGLLRTFGRIMPVGMTAAPILAGLTAPTLEPGTAQLLGWLALATTAAALVSTIAVNVTINLATGRWDPADPPANWRQTRRRWETFQGVRSWLLLAGFVLLTAAETLT
ncbi:MAG TPA: anthrone oxygenase family protein [Jiangellaceae bacterium]|nr:anthrone oxygenase family protein [Jiangellaceae bacterium]